MKRLLYSFSILLSLFMWTACSGPSQQESEKNSEEQAEQPAEATDLTMTEDQCPAQSPGNSEISKACAKQMLDDFESLVQNQPNKQFVLGFQTNHGDIVALRNDPDISNADTIYAMIGYNSRIASFELIFAIETPVNSGQYRYFDFTKPCPIYCPGFLDSATTPPPTLSQLNGNKGYWFGRNGLSKFLGIAAGEGVQSYLYYPNNNWSGDIHLVECSGECEEPTPGTEEWHFEPCNPDPNATCGEGAEPPCCHTID